jgi:all-trans-retinol dehydrogenase (NAD+)
MVKRSTALKVLSAPIKLVFGDFRLQLPLLLALIYYPDKLKSVLPERLYPWIASAGFQQGLKVLLGLNVTRFVNTKLSQYVINNWKPDAKWINSQEIVLITGGSSGIGELMALDFAKRGVKVISLDVNPPKKPQRKSLTPESPNSTAVH